MIVPKLEFFAPEPIFTINLADLKKLSDAVCELDAFKPALDVRIAELVTDCHDILIRALGDRVEEVYRAPDQPQTQPERTAA